MTAPISIIFATRKRPANIERLFWSVDATAKTTKPEIIIYVDNDDPDSEWMANGLGINYVKGPRHTLSQCYNEAAELAKSDILMYAGDDIVFRTPDWDVMVVKEFEKYKDKILVVHGDDQSHGGDRAATHGFLHRRWIDCVGYFVPPYFGSWFDNWITDVANMLGRRVFLPFVNEHLHFTARYQNTGQAKATMDSTYIEAREHQRNDMVLFEQLRPQRLEDAAKLCRLKQDNIMFEKVPPVCGRCDATCVVLTQGYNICTQCGFQMAL